MWKRKLSEGAQVDFDVVMAEVAKDLKSRSLWPPSGTIVSASLNGGHAMVVLSGALTDKDSLENWREAVERDLRARAAAVKVSVVLTAEQPVNLHQKENNDPHRMAKNPRLDHLPIKKIVAVASGKGGVGKSTVSYRLAHALAQAGMTVGLLDADIYGPSVPTLAGLSGQKPQRTEDARIVPFDVKGVKVMSIGFLVEPEKSLVWRGPMVQTALYQLLRDVAWANEAAPLDVLLVDMPPGTGDAQLTLAQKVPLAGAIIVSTPQDLALIDARKAVDMFSQTKVPILGLIENMAQFICPECGHEAHIFGHDTLQDEAKRMHVPYLGSLPLSMSLRHESDHGNPSEETSRLFEPIADKVRRALA